MIRRLDIEQLDVKVLILNLYITQLITFVIALVLFFLLQKLNPIEAISTIWPENIYLAIKYGLIFGFIVISIDLFLSWKLPDEMLDDGGINEKLFKNTPIWHIFIIANIVGFVEESLFRGALQPLIGVWITSLIFTIIHFRYLNKWILLLVTFLISIGLGYLSILTNGWLSSYIAHMMIDFILGVFIRKGWLSFSSR